MAERKTREELERDWWEKWRDKNFSWEELGALHPWGSPKHPWDGWMVPPGGALGQVVKADGAPEGSRSATLQDYWSDQKDNLVHGDGKNWTRAHVPLQWADGAPAKAAWDKEQLRALDQILEEKLRTTQRDIGGTRTSAQLQGIVLTKPLPSIDDALTARLDYAALSGSAFAHVKRIESGFTCSSACFLTYLSLRSTDIGASADFSHALFAEGVDLRGKFAGNVAFRYAKFCGYLNASEVNFGGAADFSDASFEVAHFHDTDFKMTDFSDAKFNRRIEFDGANFDGRADFARAKFEAAASFEKSSKRATTFAKEAIFHSVAFGGWTTFESCSFSGTVDFERAIFSDEAGLSQLICRGDVTFESTKWEKGVWLVDATFEGKANFDFSIFEADLWAKGVRFAGDVSFGRTRFRSIAFLNNAKFESDMNFGGCTFSGPAEFNRANFPVRAEHYSGAFSGARFEDIAAFSEAKTHWIAALDQAILGKKLVVDPPPEHEATAEFEKMVRAAAAAAPEDLKNKVETETKQRAEDASKAGGAPKPISNAERRKWRFESRERRLRELEGGCRAVKLAMGAERNEVQEQRYYRFQLIARRKQKVTPGWEKCFSHLYALTSDYGTSITKPVVAIAFFLVVFAASYLTMGLGLDRALPQSAVGNLVSDGWSAFSFSWNNTFRPLSALSAEVVRQGDGSWLSTMLYGFGPAFGFALRALATVQSLLAIVLAFLFALAVRRRFQIS